MSKKKATMTLKDFHGGSIPSDLPLPSAPGVTVKPVDRVGFNPHTSWGNSMGRSDHWLRPSSAGSIRNLDNSTPFLTHSSLIGRNFDEDERKPLDGFSGPRRTVIDETIRPQSARVVPPKMDNLSGARVGSQSAYFLVPPISSGSAGEIHNMGFNNKIFSAGHGYSSNYPNMGASTGQPVSGSGSYPNAWGIRKESVSIKESVSATWSVPDAATKLAHASALEKVSSGRWNSKQSVPTLVENERDFLYKPKNIDSNNNNYDRLDLAGDNDYHNVSMMSGLSLSIDDGGGVKEISTHERVMSTHHVDSYERNPSVINGSQLSRPTRKSDAFLSEPSERPKLKLIPRTKPLENLEQGYHQPTDHLTVDNSSGVHEPTNPPHSDFTGLLSGDRAPERPKLNLKPRSQPHEHLEGNSGIRKDTVFGTARPRELILKERGIEDFALNNYEIHQSPLRIKEDSAKIHTPAHVAASRPAEKDISKYNDRRDHQLGGERPDSLMSNRRNEIRKDQRKVDKRHNQQQQLQDRPPSPETWRKFVEQPKQTRHGKAASAVELAQAFSKRVPDTKLVTSRGQIPFSRLMGPTLNGY